MALILDSIFHTKTMVKVLKDQGDLRIAEKICQEILTKNPLDSEANELLKSVRSLIQSKASPFFAAKENISSPSDLSHPNEEIEENV